MSLSKGSRHLLDVNVLAALTARSHVHHWLVKEWFYASPSLPWGVCAFTEAGFLRNATAPRPGQIAMSEATAVLEQLTRHPGYRYLPIAADWKTLCSPYVRMRCPRTHQFNRPNYLWHIGACLLHHRRHTANLLLHSPWPIRNRHSHRDLPTRRRFQLTQHLDYPNIYRSGAAG